MPGAGENALNAKTGSFLFLATVIVSASVQNPLAGEPARRPARSVGEFTRTIEIIGKGQPRLIGCVNGVKHTPAIGSVQLAVPAGIDCATR